MFSIRVSWLRNPLPVSHSKVGCLQSCACTLHVTSLPTDDEEDGDGDDVVDVDEDDDDDDDDEDGEDDDEEEVGLSYLEKENLEVSQTMFLGHDAEPRIH